jgi:coproporphyrinogen III oxidase
MNGPVNGVVNSRSARATQWIAGLHDDTTAVFTELDGGGVFIEDRWMREGGGGGVSRVLSEGNTFEKVGVNRSAVYGALAPEVAARLGGRVNAEGENTFFATGVSIVAHPRSPRVPTVHLNVRYFEITDENGNVQDAWFGGGTDLTPTFPDAAHPRFFHRQLRAACDAHHSSLYPRFKPWCDQYFRNTHRDGEARGVGGVFFDHVRPLEDESGLDDNGLFAFAGDIAHSLRTAYAPIVNSQRDVPTNDEERSLQLTRRGRYVEFNLLHDRGTLFGLQTGARVESVLMSLPPLAKWVYTPEGSASALSNTMTAMLAPRDWANDTD